MGDSLWIGLETSNVIVMKQRFSVRRTTKAGWQWDDGRGNDD